jgi:methylmalonyl-CoA/ethylmalonyl-CoA epimerase
MQKNTPSESIFSNLDHICVVVKDIDKTIKRLESLGIGPFRQASLPPDAEGMYYRGKRIDSNFIEFKAPLGNIELEIFQPDDKPSPWKEFLDTKGEGIHHLGFKVKDFDKAIDKLTAQGAEVIIRSMGQDKVMGAVYFDLKVGNIIVNLLRA